MLRGNRRLDVQTIAGYTDGTVTANGIAFHYLEWGDPRRRRWYSSTD